MRCILNRYSFAKPSTVAIQYTVYRYSITSVAEPSLFRAAPAPEVRGPGADSGFDQIGSALAPGKKAVLAPYTNIFHFELLKSELLMHVFFGSHTGMVYRYKLLLSHVLSQQDFPFSLAKKKHWDPDQNLNF